MAFYKYTIIFHSVYNNPESMEQLETWKLGVFKRGGTIFYQPWLTVGGYNGIYIKTYTYTYLCIYMYVIITQPTHDLHVV